MRGRAVLDLPQRRQDAAGAGELESLHEADEALTRDLSSQSRVACRESDQVRLDPAPGGVIVTFAVVENPQIRTVTLEGNDNLGADEIKERMTLTVGSTVDYPLLRADSLSTLPDWWDALIPGPCDATPQRPDAVDLARRLDGPRHLHRLLGVDQSMAGVGQGGREPSFCGFC